VPDDRPNLRAPLAGSLIAVGGVHQVALIDTILNSGIQPIDSFIARYEIHGTTGDVVLDDTLRDIPGMGFSSEYVEIPINIPYMFRPGLHTVEIYLDPEDWVDETEDVIDNNYGFQFEVDHFQVTYEDGTVFSDTTATAVIPYDNGHFQLVIPPRSIRPVPGQEVLVIQKVEDIAIPNQGLINTLPPTVILRTTPPYDTLAYYPWDHGYQASFVDPNARLFTSDTSALWIKVDSLFQIDMELWAEEPQISLYRQLPQGSYWTKIPDCFVAGYGINFGEYVSVEGFTQTLGTYSVLMSTDTCVTCGPKIDISVEGQLFGEGSYVPTRPKITALLQDYSGIDRSSGNFWAAYGDEFTGDTLGPDDVVWTDTLEAGGTMGATISPVFDEGAHWVAFYATDNNGNHSFRQINFQVAGQFEVLYVGNYPNPFQTRTMFTYTLTDQADERVRIKIYTVSGRLIRTLHDPLPHPVNYREVFWDGKDKLGNPVANGVYFARLRAVKGDHIIEETLKVAKIR
jgi:hypothetical protein